MTERFPFGFAAMNDNILYHALATRSILRATPPLRAPRPAPPFPLVSSVLYKKTMDFLQ